jgi:HKD family nuclease
VNVGQSAGQTVFHLHVHVIPRCSGDVTDPRGGVRHVLAGKAKYLAMIDGLDFVRDTQAFRQTGHPPIPREQLVTGGLDDALLRPLLDDLDTAHRVDIAAAFVLESGVDLIYAHRREVLEREGAVRFLTGDYMDATDPRALRRLLDLEGDIQRRVFESANQSFHPKAYIFVRRSGGGVAYVGSSNLTNPALTHGIEWNYRVSSLDNPAGFAEATRFAVPVCWSEVDSNCRSRSVRREGGRLQAVSVLRQP